MNTDNYDFAINLAEQWKTVYGLWDEADELEKQAQQKRKLADDWADDLRKVEQRRHSK